MQREVSRLMSYVRGGRNECDNIEGSIQVICIWGGKHHRNIAGAGTKGSWPNLYPYVSANTNIRLNSPYFIKVSSVNYS